MKRTSLNAHLNGTRGHKSATFMPKVVIKKFECKKVLFNICGQDEVLLPRRTFFPLKLKDVPDEPFHNFRASRSGDRRILFSSGTPCDGF